MSVPASLARRWARAEAGPKYPLRVCLFLFAMSLVACALYAAALRLLPVFSAPLAVLGLVPCLMFWGSLDLLWGHWKAHKARQRRDRRLERQAIRYPD